jgi:diguanylate cyclase (GGDEF)-like protein
MTFSSLPRASRIYTATVTVAGAVLVMALGPRATFEQPVLFAALLALSVLVSAFKVSLPLTRSGSTMSISYAVDLAALILLGPHEAMLVAVASAWSQCTLWTRTRTRAYQTIFSMAALAITVQLAGLTYAALGGLTGDLGGALTEIARPVVGAAIVYFVSNTLLVATAIALSTDQSVLKLWHNSFLWSTPSYFVGAAVAVGGAWAIMDATFWAALLLAAPLYLTYYSYRVYLGRIDDERRHAAEMADLNLATIEALALAIEANNQTSHPHIRREQVYAASLAAALGMTDSEIQGVKTAALLHDIGKLAVPEHILSKPGPVTPEEFQKIRVHPQIGAQIISGVPFPYPVAPLILSHHERWDGKGYPHGLKGEQIPLGARILAVVDHYDAMTSERPYHKAMTHEAALALLTQESGRALDPHVVSVFIRILPDLMSQVAGTETTPARRLSLDDEARGARTGASAAGFKTRTVFDDIAHAHREIYALYELAQSLGTALSVSDTMAVIGSKLSKLVPFTSCALFLMDESADTLHCRFAKGAEADVLMGLTIPTGQGLIGWVARNRRPLINARPTADFEAAGVTNHVTILHSALVLPLVYNDTLVGTLAVYHEPLDFYTDDHRRLLERVCQQASAVVHNAVMFEQTQQDSLTDQLTGLPNTRFMFLHLQRELARAERMKSEVALLVLDLDEFKQINDTYGHRVGDRALQEVAAVLRGVIRPYDICVRYAGDEFVILLSGCGHDEAERKRIEAQRTVDEIVFEAHTGRRVPLAISAGVAIYPHDGDTYEALLAGADSRMYRDKTRRKKQPHLFAVTGDDGPGGLIVHADAATEPTEIEIQRAGLGVL